MLETLLNLDRSITLSLNGSSSLYADGLMMAVTSTLTWVPVGLVLLYVIWKNNNMNMPRFLLIVLLMVLCVFVSNQLSSLCKAFFERWRPARDPHIMYFVDVVNGYRGGRFGFFSAHAANTMSIAVFLSLLFRQGRMTLLLLSWTLLNGYSRIYLGVHYFGDVIVGFAVGILVGCLMKIVYNRICRRLDFVPGGISSEYTAGGYLAKDVNMLASTQAFTYVVIAVMATFLVILDTPALVF